MNRKCSMIKSTVNKKTYPITNEQIIFKSSIKKFDFTNKYKKPMGF